MIETQAYNFEASKSPIFGKIIGEAQEAQKRVSEWDEARLFFLWLTPEQVALLERMANANLAYQEQVKREGFGQEYSLAAAQYMKTVEESVELAQLLGEEYATPLARILNLISSKNTEAVFGRIGRS